jgi:hypothetical protein
MLKGILVRGRSPRTKFCDERSEEQNYLSKEEPADWLPALRFGGLRLNASGVRYKYL